MIKEAEGVGVQQATPYLGKLKIYVLSIAH